MAEPLLLALETSTLAGSLALAEGARLLGEQELPADRRNAADLFPRLRDMLGAAGAHLSDVKVVAFSQGPGSFTGLRIAATIARMMHDTCESKVVAVPTLAVIARNALQEAGPAGRIAVLTDARRKQVYAGSFEREGDVLRVVRPPAVVDPATWLRELGADGRAFVALGDACGQVGELIAQAGGSVLDEAYWRPRATEVVALAVEKIAAGEFCTPEQIVPQYTRPPECEEVYEQRRAEARAKRGE